MPVAQGRTEHMSATDDRCNAHDKKELIGMSMEQSAGLETGFVGYVGESTLNVFRRPEFFT
jgi:hypothetical protein